MKLKNKTLAVCNGRMMKAVLIRKRTTKSSLGTDLISIGHQPSAKNVLSFLICFPFCLPKITIRERFGFGKPHEPALLSSEKFRKLSHLKLFSASGVDLC